jgi:hypothetical protein
VPDRKEAVPQPLPEAHEPPFGIAVGRNHPLGEGAHLRPSKVVVANVRWGTRLGVLFACIYTFIALAIFTLQGPATYRRNLGQLGLAILVYFGGGIAAGTIVGLLRPLTRDRGWAIVVGIVAALPMFFGAAVAVRGGIAALGPDMKFSIVLCSLVLGSFAGNYLWSITRSG